MEIVIIGLVFLVVGLVVFIINQSSKYENKLLQIQKENSSLKTENFNINSKNMEIIDESFTLQAEWSDKLREADEKIHDLEKKIVELNAQEVVESVRENYNKELENELENLQKLIQSKHEELELISTNAASIASDEKEKLRQLEALEGRMKDLEGRILSGKEVLERLESEIRFTSHELDELAHLKASILAVEDGSGTVWEITPGVDKIRLVELIHQLVSEYGNQFPILRKELLKAEWSSVWLPPLQQLCSREKLDRSGIYKITLKANDRVVYIGQAQSIKDRWYTHFKKMLGVEAKGTERLYEFRPDEVTWEVVEFKEGNLDSDEKYWIDYYKCREIGLNKKG